MIIFVALCEEFSTCVCKYLLLYIVQCLTRLRMQPHGVYAITSLNCFNQLSYAITIIIELFMWFFLYWPNSPEFSKTPG